MNGSDTRVTSYLDDLARMLSDLDPGTRDDVLAGVREHLDAVAAEHPGDPAALEQALVRLGPPERIAAEARADVSATPAATPPTATTTPGLGRVGVGLLALSTIVPPVLVAVSVAQRLGDPGSGMFGPDLVLFLGASVLFWPWIAGVVCVLAAGGFTTRTRVRLALMGPVMTAVVVLASLWNNPETTSAAVSLALLGALVVFVGSTVRRGWQEMSRS